MPFWNCSSLFFTRIDFGLQNETFCLILAKKADKNGNFLRNKMPYSADKTGKKVDNIYNKELFFFPFYTVSELLYNREVRKNSNIVQKI